MVFSLFVKSGTFLNFLPKEKERNEHCCLFTRCYPLYNTIASNPVAQRERPVPPFIGEEWKLEHSQWQNQDSDPVPVPKLHCFRGPSELADVLCVWSFREWAESGLSLSHLLPTEGDTMWSECPAQYNPKYQLHVFSEAAPSESEGMLL